MQNDGSALCARSEMLGHSTKSHRNSGLLLHEMRPAILRQLRPVFLMPADNVIGCADRAFTARWPRIGRPMWRGALSTARSWRQPSRCTGDGRTGSVVVSGERSRSEGREERLHAVLASIAEGAQALGEALLRFADLAVVPRITAIAMVFMMALSDGADRVRAVQSSSLKVTSRTW